MSTFFCMVSPDRTSFHSSEKDCVSGRTSNGYLLTWDRDLFITPELCFCKIWLSWKNSLCVPWKIKICSSLENLCLFLLSCLLFLTAVKWASVCRQETAQQPDLHTLFTEYSRKVLNSSQYVLDHGNKSPEFTWVFIWHKCPVSVQIVTCLWLDVTVFQIPCCSLQRAVTELQQFPPGVFRPATLQSVPLQLSGNKNIYLKG